MSNRIADSSQPGITVPISTSNARTTTTTTSYSLSSNLNLNSNLLNDSLSSTSNPSVQPNNLSSNSNRNDSLEYSELHLAPATRTSVVTTTTTTTVHFAPILIPRTTRTRPILSEQYPPPFQSTSNLNNNNNNRNSFIDLVEREGEVGNRKVLELDPKLYPLSQAIWPESMKKFKMPLGSIEATFMDANSRRLSGIEMEEEEDDMNDRLVTRSEKGKERETYEEEEGGTGGFTFSNSAASLARLDRGSTAQRRKTRRARSILPSGVVAEEQEEEEEEEADLNNIEMDSTNVDLARLPSPGQPPRKRPRAGSNSSMESEAGGIPPRGDSVATSMNYIASTTAAASNTGLASTTAPVGLPSPNLSPPSPVPTFPGDGSQDCLDEEVETGVTSNEYLQPPFDLGSGKAISGLLSLPDFVNTFDQLPPSLQAYFIFTFLKRSPIPVLQTINNIIAPSLRRDFLADLPPELAVQVLGYLDGKALCRAAAACKGWRRLVDGEWRVWQERLISDGLWIGDGSEEREAKEIAGGNKENLFLKRWKAGIWDDTPRSNTKSIDVSMQVDGEQHESPRRLSHPGKLASPSSSREPTPQPQLPPHYVHPYKVLYRRRFATRYNWANREPKRVNFACHANNVVTCLQFDKNKIVSASDDHSINVFDTRTGETKSRLNGHEGGVWALQYIGNILVSGSTDRTVRIWDLDTGKCTHVFVGHTSTVRCLQIVQPENINPDPSGEPIWEPPYPIIVTGSRDWTLRVWRLPSPGKDHEYHPNVPMSPTEENTDPTDNPFHLRQLSGHRHAVRALAAHGRTLVSGSYDCQIRVWDLLTGECRHRLTGHQQKVYSVVFDPIRKQCASGSMDGTVRLWSTETGECKATLNGHSSLVGLLGLSFTSLVSAAADTTLRIWDPTTGELRHVLAAHSGAITCFQHDESKIISGSDGTLKMWDVRDGTFTRDLLTGLTGVWQVSFDQRFCVAAVQRNAQSEFDILDFGPVDPNEDDEEEEEVKGQSYLEELVPSTNTTTIDIVATGGTGGEEGEGIEVEGGDLMDDSSILDQVDIDDHSPQPTSRTRSVPSLRVQASTTTTTSPSSSSRTNRPRSTLDRSGGRTPISATTPVLDSRLPRSTPTASTNYHARIAAVATTTTTTTNNSIASSSASSSSRQNRNQLDQSQVQLSSPVPRTRSTSRDRRERTRDIEDPFGGPRIPQEAVMRGNLNHDDDENEEEEIEDLDLVESRNGGGGRNGIYSGEEEEEQEEEGGHDMEEDEVMDYREEE